jgi:orotidine-5'-phosphate decarboxylase
MVINSSRAILYAGSDADFASAARAAAMATRSLLNDAALAR